MAGLGEIVRAGFLGECYIDADAGCCDDSRDSLGISSWYSESASTLATVTIEPLG